MLLQPNSVLFDSVGWFEFQRTISANGKLLTQPRRMSSAVCVCRSRHGGKVDQDWVDSKLHYKWHLLLRQANCWLCPLRTAGQVCPDDCRSLFCWFLSLRRLTFRFLRYIFHSLFPFMIVCFVVIIINHRNRLFSSPLSENVRNFPDVIML